MTRRYYHLYTIPTQSNEQARRRNVDPVRSAKESRAAREWWNQQGLPTAVYVNDQPTSPEFLPFGERLWT